MGKQKVVVKSSPTTDVVSPANLIKNGEKKQDSIKPERKPAEKVGGPKDVGVKDSKKGQKSEIDDIFSVGKEKKALESKRAVGEAVAKEPGGAAAKRPRVEGSKDDIFGEAGAKGRKRTEEGFPVYTEEELGMGKKGGDTDLCPFDCDCCF